RQSGFQSSSASSVAASRSGASRHFTGINQQASSSKSVASRPSSTRTGRLFSANTHHNQPPQEPQSHVVCAITENLAREACIVSIDTAYPMILNVTKQCNAQTYAESIACLSILEPHEILMNECRQHSPLARKVLQHCKFQRQSARETAEESNATRDVDGLPVTTTLKFISRAYFDQTRGADLLRRLARKDTYDNSLVQEYILLSSSHAVLHYTQRCLGLSFMSNCLDIRTCLADPNGTMRPRVMDIDRASIIQLELLASIKPGKSKEASLIGVMDFTKTSVGNRLLRSTIMSPPCRLATIHARQELVATFGTNQPLFYSMLDQLQKLNPIDKMLTHIAMVSTSASATSSASMDAASTVSGVHTVQTKAKLNVTNASLARKGIAALIGIKATLGMIPLIASTLKNHLQESIGAVVEETGGDAKASVATDKTSLLVGLGVGDFASLATTRLTEKTASTRRANKFPPKHYLLRGIVYALTRPELDDIRNQIDQALRSNDVHSQTGSMQLHQECFALRNCSDTDNHGMIDVLRKAFLQNVDDIYKMADHYADTHGFHVTVTYQNNRGYFLKIPATTDLPEEFIQPVKTNASKYIHCTTEEVQSLNARAQDNINDILRLTQERIEALLDYARKRYDDLARVSDAIALLDLCHCFADKATIDKGEWVRPKLVDHEVEQEPGKDAEVISIREGRCPIDVSAVNPGMTEMVVNDVHCTASQTFNVVSGVNGSGKSTYLKQVAIIVLLAHCGSYVPAHEAIIPVSS
ncbi:MAG: hypothetical protein SGILL_008469, partial [Bacillariaceae sp.]